jgi:hypothetical protein
MNKTARHANQKQGDSARPILVTKDFQLASSNTNHSIQGMKSVIVCSLMMVGSLVAENLFSNGNMDTAGGWKGSGKIIKAEPVKGTIIEEGAKAPVERYLQITAKKNGPVSFNQEIDTKDVFGVVLRFCYRTKDYKGPGLEMRGTRMDRSSTFTNRDLVADGEWHEMTWDFKQVAGSRKVDFSFIVLQGEGEVQFDNITAEALK